MVSCETNFSHMSKEKVIDEKSLSVKKDDFSFFWLSLGKALNIEDTIFIDKYLDTSLFFHGREDEDTILELKGSKRIDVFLKIYLNGGVYDYENDRNISFKELFLNESNYKKEYVEGDSIQEIFDFSFKTNNEGDWKLFRVYCDTKSILEY